MRTQRIALAFAASLAVLALTACSGDAKSSDESVAPAVPGETSVADADPGALPAGDTMQIHPCLLTGEEVASVLDGNYDDGVLNKDFSEYPNYICNYTNTDTGATALGITVVMPRGYTAQEQRPGYEDGFADVVDVTLAGADYAFTAGGGSIVISQVGVYGIFVANNENKGDDPDGNTLRLAQIAVSHA